LPLLASVATLTHHTQRWLFLDAFESGDPTHTTARGISIARRQADGGWKLARDIWNHDAPGS